MNFNIVSLACVIALVVNGLEAQISDSSASGGLTYFSTTHSNAAGAKTGSATYALRGSIGDQAPAAANSTTYAVAGGFLATLEAASAGPWLTSASARIVGPRSTDLVWLRGARLNLGGAPTVTVSGRAATVVAKSNTDVAIRLPSLPTPGWHEVELKNSGGTTSLERGLGVLPILYTEGAPASNAPFDLIFKGTRGDVVAWALGVSPGPVIPVANFLHGLTINTSFVRVLPTIRISDPSGEFRMSIPPVPFRVAIYIQAMFVTSNRDYTPGSFSNMLRFK
jgi:IPT/TIG domain